MPRSDAAAGAAFDCVVTHHLNPFTSGVARFNAELAQRAGVPLLGVLDDAAPFAAPLLSFKVGELPDAEAAAVAHTVQAAPTFDFFFHDFQGLPFEQLVVRSARTLWCGNHEIAARIGPDERRRVVWAPGLILDQRTYAPSEVSIFSFGMAHKVRTDIFRRLRELLEATERSYSLYVSNANHETATLQDAQAVYDEMHEIFPAGLYFMGNLSDVAVFNFLRTTTFFAAFFSGGVRANNTSIASAMEQGCVVLTNLDEHSPPHLEHMRNVIDVTRCERLPTDPLELRRIGLAAMETARRYSWDALVDEMLPPSL